MIHLQSALLPLIALLLLLKRASADVATDSGITSAMSTVQQALPSLSLAVLGVWSVLQYTEAWSVDDGPLSGVIAWWRWRHWMPPPAREPRLCVILDSHPGEPAAKGFTHRPSVSMPNLVTCWLLLILCVTPIRRGIFWDSYGAYAIALFVTFIVSWRCLVKLVVPIPIPAGHKDAFRRASASPDMHNPKSRVINILAGLSVQSVYGVVARHELCHANAADVLGFLTSRGLCEECRRYMEGTGRRGNDSWRRLLELLERHGEKCPGGASTSEDCSGAMPPFKWTRRGPGGAEPLVIDDPNIGMAMVEGELGEWRVHKPIHLRRLRGALLFAVLVPLCFGFQIVVGMFSLAIPVYRVFGTASNGTTYYIPLNKVARSGTYLSNGTITDSFPSSSNTYSWFSQWSLAAIFVAIGLTAFVIACLEAWAAQWTYPMRILTQKTLRLLSCGMSALYSLFFGICLSFAAGYTRQKPIQGVAPWQTTIEYTLALLLSGVFLCMAFIVRGINGVSGDTKSWAMPLLLQSSGTARYTRLRIRLLPAWIFMDAAWKLWVDQVERVQAMNRRQRGPPPI